MAKKELIGYHTTTRQNAEKILSSTFEVNLKTNDDWLGEGIYFWEDIANAQWWKSVHFKGTTYDTCTLCAKLICDEEEYIDLSIAKNMNDLVNFADTLANEMAEMGMFFPDFKTPNQMKHFYCTAFKKKYQIKIMRHTFEHKEINPAGFQMLRPQLCATDASVVHDVESID